MVYVLKKFLSYSRLISSSLHVSLILCFLSFCHESSWMYRIYWQYLWLSSHTNRDCLYFPLRDELPTCLLIRSYSFLSFNPRIRHDLGWYGSFVMSNLLFFLKSQIQSNRHFQLAVVFLLRYCNIIYWYNLSHIYWDWAGFGGWKIKEFFVIMLGENWNFQFDIKF